ncbi:uncharacterized protein LOC106051777 isoform X1 [Biomphalaria glabrata]|uniref:Uncharacterized protein LOC106051777 isoform X1 n=1 Tax=Biomphalaria glabrata TaxID=6526 RepID=A0A9W2ZGZ6_BIOGL|nr:uncharacterized protein LOC106051777 isoform X1 [Biomphalaria glabrata]
MTDGFADHWTTNKYRDSREDVASQLQGHKFRGHGCTLFYDCLEPSDDVISADTSQLWAGLHVVVDDSGDASNEPADFGSETYVTDGFSYGDIPLVAQSPKSDVLLRDSESLVEQRNRLDEGLHAKCSTDCLNVDITLSEIQHCKKCETSEIEKQGCSLSLESHKEHQRHKHIGTAINSRHSSRHRHIGTAINSRHSSRHRHIGTAINSRHSSRHRHIGTAINSRHSRRRRHIGTAINSRHSSRHRHIGTAINSRHSSRHRHIGTAINSRHSSRHRHIGTAVNSRHSSRHRHINTTVRSRNSVDFSSLKRYHLFSPHSGKRKFVVRRSKYLKGKVRTKNDVLFTDSTCSELCSDHSLHKKLTAERTLRSSFSETNVVTKCYVWNESSSTSCARLCCNSVPENEVIKHSENAHHLQCEYDKTSLHLTTKANYLIGCHLGSQENNQMSRELILNDSNINKEISTLIGNLNRELQVRSSNVHRSELDGRLHLENPISLTNDTGLNWNSNAEEHLRHEEDDEYLESRLTDPILTSKLQKIREDREGLMFVVNLLLTWNIIQLLVLFATLFYACICICSFRKVFGCGELCLLKPKPQPKSAKKRWWST